MHCVCVYSFYFWDFVFVDWWVSLIQPEVWESTCPMLTMLLITWSFHIHFNSNNKAQTISLLGRVAASPWSGIGMCDPSIEPFDRPLANVVSPVPDSRQEYSTPKRRCFASLWAKSHVMPDHDEVPLQRPKGQAVERVFTAPPLSPLDIEFYQQFELPKSFDTIPRWQCPVNFMFSKNAVCKLSTFEIGRWRNHQKLALMKHRLRHLDA